MDSVLEKITLYDILGYLFPDKWCNDSLRTIVRIALDLSESLNLNSVL